MRALILLSLLGLAACDGMMEPTTSSEDAMVTTEQLEIAGDSLDAEMVRQGIYVPMTDRCAEDFGFWAEEFVKDPKEYPTAHRLIQSWLDVESEGDPEVSCLLAVDR